MNLKSFSLLTILIFTSWLISAADDSGRTGSLRRRSTSSSRRTERTGDEHVSSVRDMVFNTSICCLVTSAVAAVMCLGSAVHNAQGPTPPDLTNMYSVVNKWDCAYAQTHLLPLPAHCLHRDDDNKKDR